MSYVLPRQHMHTNLVHVPDAREITLLGSSLRNNQHRTTKSHMGRVVHFASGYLFHVAQHRAIPDALSIGCSMRHRKDLTGECHNDLSEDWSGRQNQSTS
eukprot:3542748-Amphidinium_carterae.2